MYYLYWIHLEEHTDPFSEGYVGVSTQPEVRFRQHSTDLTVGSGSQVLRQIVAELGKECLQHTILASYEDQLEARQAEQHYRPKTNIGWNIWVGGGVSPDCTGREMSEETRAKIAESNRLTKSTRSYESPFKGMNDRHSDETKALIGSYHKGKTISEAHRNSARKKLSRERSPRARPVTLRNMETGSTHSYKCVKSASEELGINYQTLRSAIRMKQDVVAKIWKILWQG